MSRLLLTWIRRSVIALATLILLLVVVTYFVIGTESGTRWIFARASSFVPIDIESNEASGTLLTEIRIPRVRYDDSKRVLTIEDLVFNIDWSETSFDFLTFEHLNASRAIMQNIGETPEAPTPLEISMPALPIGIATASASIASFTVDDNEIVYLTLRELFAREKSIAVARAAATTNELSVELHDFLIEVDGAIPVSGELGWRIAESPWSGTATMDGTLGELELQHTLAGDYPADTYGSVELLGKIQPVVDLTTQFKGWRYQDLSAKTGEVRIVGTIDDYDATFTAAVVTDAAPDADISGEASGNTRGIQALDVTIKNEFGQAQASGSVNWAPALAVDLLLKAKNIDPSAFLSIPAEDINAEVRIRAVDPSQFTIDVKSLSGKWNGQPTTGSGNITRQANAWICGDCRLLAGRNRINIDGRLDERRLAGVVDIDAPALHQLWSGLSGSIVAKGRLGGTAALPVLSGTASASEFEFAEWRVEYLSLQTHSSSIDALDVDLEFRELLRSEARFGNARIDIIGSADSLELTAEWSLDDYAAAAAATVVVEGDSIDGEVHSAQFTEPYNGEWVLSSPILFSSRADSMQVGSAMWTNDKAFIRSDSVRIEGDVLSADGAIGNLPLSVFNFALPDSLRMEGLADATITVSNESGKWSGLIDWQQHETRLLFPGSIDDFVLVVPTAHAALRLDNNAAVLQATVNAEPGLSSTLDMSTDDLSITSPLDARLRFSGEEWEWITTLAPDIQNIEGIIVADLHATGTIESPELSGEARWQRGALAVPALNLPLTDIDVTLTGTTSGDLSIDGNATTGDGTISVGGRLIDIASDSPSFDIVLTGDEANLLNWPGYQATLSPNIKLNGDLRGAKIAGRVDIDSADIIVRELPVGAIRRSRDVTVVGREEGAREETLISGEIEVAMGDSFHLHAFGLDTNLEGEMLFILREDREPQGRGEVRLVGGYFQAYGQRLEIEHGTMIFTGPLDDPLINVRATRHIDHIDGAVVAGINLSGRAREINSSIFSEPAMSEAEALSYLVLGRPLEDASAVDGNALANSAYSLGLRQAALITNQIGQTVGLDELTVGGKNQNTTELIAGKQLNSRLYARYAYGVFSRLGKLLLRYRLSDSFSVELGAGENQSMDLLYTIEKE